MRTQPASAETFPQSSVIGTDIVPIKPKHARPNCYFQQHDAIADEWDFHVKFDFIHVRCVGWLIEYKTLLSRVSDNLTPGGWAEFSEYVLRLDAPDGSMRGTAMEKLNLLLRQGDFVPTYFGCRRADPDSVPQVGQECIAHYRIQTCARAIRLRKRDGKEVFGAVEPVAARKAGQEDRDTARNEHLHFLGLRFHGSSTEDSRVDGRSHRGAGC